MLEYQPLNISEFVCGYIKMVKLYPQIQEDLYAHLQLLIGKAMTYSWTCVKTFHLDGTCEFLFEEGPCHGDNGCGHTWHSNTIVSPKSNSVITLQCVTALEFLDIML